MLGVEESTSFSMEGGYEHGEFGGDGGLGAEDLSIDLDMLIDIMDEEHDDDGSDPNENCLDESLKSASRRDADIDANHQGDDFVYSNSLNVSSNLEDSKSRIGGPGGSTVNQDLIFDHGVEGSVENTGYASHKDWISLSSGDGNCNTEKAGFSLSTCSTSSTVYPRDDGNIPEFEDKIDVNNQRGQFEIIFGTAGAETNRLGVPKHSSLENSSMDFCKYDMFRNNSAGTMGATEHNFCTSMQFSFVDGDMSGQDIISKGPAICYSTGATKGYFAAQDDPGPDYRLSANYNSQIFSTNEEPIKNVKNKEWGFRTDSACSNTMMKLNDQRGNSEKSAIEIEGWDYQHESNDYTSMTHSSFDVDRCQVDEKSLMQKFDGTRSYFYCEDQVKNEKPDEFAVRDFSIWDPYGIHEVAIREASFSADYKYFGEDSRSSLSGISCSLPGHNTLNLMDKKRDVVDDSKVYNSSDNANGGLTSFYGNANLNMNARRHYMPSVHPFSPISNQSISIGSHLSKVSPESSHSNFSEKSNVDDDPDVCIIEGRSHPAPSSQSPVVRSLSHPYVTSQHSITNGNYMGVGGTAPKAKDERLLLRLLQDISLPTSEMTPPDGLLEVSLLRHQRIALAWMVQKETDGAHCSGGILADDQGLGKTISTISLILKERPPSYNLSHVKQDNTDTLNLDEDDNTPAVIEVKEEADTVHETPKNKSLVVLAKSRPAAGTLIVCPTSVLRQWADELRNRVTRKANLSVLVYHGTNRTKDPCELAKYDVVLTTYSIVSMEVPKQPRADEDDEEREKSEDDGLAVGLSSSKKRKYPPSSDKKRSSKKGSDGEAIESLARPLAKVGWFRVVLDEAQSIKNHRTQVARACWGLRAKRRWCLSGTPIQNAIDDLYSYFRFLKYYPFDSYKLFIAHIKGPINKSPTNGYRKLQTILKTIMLRRTKGTLLDGEPIINLPPKSIELKKVDFSQEERDFYSRLEADSRAQFEEYAAAGTVKQNYVNILLMLLRLRQACDHPFLVKGVDSHSLRSSSIETAKKLSRDEQEHLLRCLEASLAICGICNDPPEDAVVAKCGHVFCNQCISEHFTGEDHQCPKTSCKTRLNISSVFSNVTLNSCLQDQSCQGSSTDCTGPKTVDSKVSSSGDLFFKSSKIKAALDVLESLCGPQDCSSANSSSQITSDGSHGSPVVEQLLDIPERQNSATRESLNSSVKVFGEKAIVFSQWTRMLDLLEVCLKNSSIKYRRLDGTMSVVARDKAVKDFNTLPEVTVMIMSLKAASLGLNMVVACHVLLLDLWWNPTTEDQAIDRAHRIGQTRPVTVLRLTVRDTVEDRILALQQKKREMVASAFGEDGTGGGQTRLTVEDLNYLFMT